MCLSAILGTISGLALLASPVAGQGGADSVPDDDRAWIAIDNQAVIQSCSACHARDSSGRMSRLSYMRKTPEGWQTSLRRMIALNELRIDPATAREVVRYLSNHHGLAPEELRPGMFEVERRMVDFEYDDEDTNETCVPCHSLGRVITQRRTQEEWELLMATHQGYYPLSEGTLLYRGPPPGSPDAPRDTRHPMDRAISYLAEAYPLETPEWSEWSSTMRPARLAGTWTVTATQTGHGRLFGEMVIEATPGTDDEFTTRTTLTYARTGETLTRQGSTSIYTGYQWRGRSTLTNGLDPLREVLLVERDWDQMSGRWFSGDYDEFGLNVTLDRVRSDPIVTGMEPRALERGAVGQEVRIFGANLPPTLDAAAIDLGPGIAVRRVGQTASGSTTLTVDVSADAPVGPRDIFAAGARRPGAGFVYDEVHSIRVNPAWGMARVGGAAMPKRYVQFEARAYHDGPDGETETDDDVDLGMIDAEWSIEEYAATFDDDDIDFVGGIDQTGLFTPALDGPNPERSGDRNNIGDVWVVASYAPDATSPDRPLRARAHLISTVPLYMRWDSWGDIR